MWLIYGLPLIWKFLLCWHGGRGEFLTLIMLDDIGGGGALEDPYFWLRNICTAPYYTEDWRVYNGFIMDNFKKMIFGEQKIN